MASIADSPRVAIPLSSLISCCILSSFLPWAFPPALAFFGFGLPPSAAAALALDRAAFFFFFTAFFVGTAASVSTSSAATTSSSSSEASATLPGFTLPISATALAFTAARAFFFFVGLGGVASALTVDLMAAPASAALGAADVLLGFFGIFTSFTCLGFGASASSTAASSAAASGAGPPSSSPLSSRSSSS